jgi:inward rectifier potassium channel
MALFKKKNLTVDDIEVVGERRPILRDLYHGFIRAPWWQSVGFVMLVFLAVNSLFGLGYFLIGGVTSAHTFHDYFFFSVEVSGTIGFGDMHPNSMGAHLLVTLESLVSIILVAITTGLIFAKFSRPQARVEFAEHPVISPHDGVPTLMFRLGNRRDSRLIEAVLRVVLFRTERTKEGVTMYRMYDVPLERDRSPALSRSWMAFHRITEKSPLWGATPESLVKDEVEFILTLTGIDEVSAQSLHAQSTYYAKDLRFGMRHADMLSERSDGGLRLDMSRFHHLVPTLATESFPFGERGGDGQSAPPPIA